MQMQCQTMRLIVNYYDNMYCVEFGLSLHYMFLVSCDVVLYVFLYV